MTGGNSLGSLVVSLVADTIGLGKAHTEMSKLGRTAQDVTRKVGMSFDGLGRKMQYFGWYSSMYLTAPIVLFGTAAFTAARDFEWSMNKIVGLVGESRNQVNAWSKEILALGPALGSQPKKLAEAMYFITSSGFSGAQAMDILKTSTKAAATGLGDVNKLADFATSAMNAYAMQGLTASRVMDILTSAIREGKLEAVGFTNQIGQVIPVASAMGVQLDEVAASMAAMSLTGTNASESVVYLRGILNALLDPGAEAEKALNAMGTSSEYLRKVIKDEGLLPALKQVSDLTKKYGENLVSKVIPNVRAMTGFLSLLGQNYEHNLKIFREVYASTGDMDQAFLSVTNTIQYKWNQALATGQASLIKIGLALKGSIIPLLEKFAKAIGDTAAWFDSLDTPTKKMIGNSLAFLAVLGPLAAGLGFITRYLLPALKFAIIGLVNVLRILPNPIVRGVIIAFTALTLIFDKIRGVTGQTVKKQKEYNFELERFQQLVGDKTGIDEMMKNIKVLNKRQLEGLIHQIGSSIAAEEDYTVSLRAELQKRIANDEQILQYTKQFNEAKGDLAKMAAASFLHNRKLEIAEDLELQYKANRKRLDQLKKYQTEANEILSHMPSDSSGNGTSGPIKEIMEEMTKEEKIIAGLIPIMQAAGREYDSNAKYAQLYENTLEKLIPFGKAAANQIKEIGDKLMATGESTKKITKIMDDLNGELVFIEAMGQLGWSRTDMDTASYNAFSQALERLAKAGVMSGDNIDYVTGGLAEFKNKIMGVAPILDTLYKELNTIDMMSGLMGSQFDAPSAKISAYISAMQSLHNELQEGNISWMTYVARIKELVPALEEAKAAQLKYSQSQIIANGMASTSVELIGLMGSALAGTTGAWQEMAMAVLRGAQQIINTLLEQALATLFLASATMAEKEVAKKGIKGLIFAAAGIAALMALMSAAKSSASNAAHMKKGGVVPGGYPNDSYPAMLTSGEEVIPPGKLSTKNTTIKIVMDSKIDGYHLVQVIRKVERHLQNVS